MTSRTIGASSAQWNRRRVGRAWLVATAAAVTLGACGSDSAKKGASDPQAAVSGFISGVQAGHGDDACAFLAAAEKQLFVKSAGELGTPIAGDSCKTVVTAFHDALGAKADSFKGALENVSIAGDFASGDWVYSNGGGQQSVTLQKEKNGWLIGTDSNDFPSALLHELDG